MTIALHMPALSPTMETGTLAKWLVKVGDEVESGTLIAEIETDKATMEFESIDDGIVGKMHSLGCRHGDAIFQSLRAAQILELFFGLHQFNPAIYAKGFALCATDRSTGQAPRHGLANDICQIELAGGVVCINFSQKIE